MNERVKVGERNYCSVGIVNEDMKEESIGLNVKVSESERLSARGLRCAECGERRKKHVYSR